MTETNEDRLQVIIDLHRRRIRLSTESVNCLIEQAERAQKLEKMLEGNAGMSVKEIQAQFVDLHRGYLGVQKENEQILDLLVGMRSTFDELDEKAEGHGMDDAVACPLAVAQYATSKFKRTVEENERLKKALYVAFFNAVESQLDGTIDVITDTLQGLDFIDMWNADCEKGKKLFEEWMK